MKNKKILLLLMISLIFTTTLSGCGKNNTVSNNSGNTSSVSSSDEVVSDYKNYVYKGELVSEGLNFDTDFVPYSDGFYNISFEYPEIEDEGELFVEESLEDIVDSSAIETTEDSDEAEIVEDEEQEEWIVTYTIDFYNSDLEKTDTTSFSGDEQSYGQLLHIDKDKNLYFGVTSYSDEEGDSSYLLKTNKDGEEIYRIKCDFDNDYSYGNYIRDIFENKDSLFIVDGHCGVYPVDNEKATIGKAVYSGNEDNYTSFFSLNDEIVLVENDFNGGIKVGTLDVNKGIVSYIDIEIPASAYDFCYGHNNTLLAMYDGSLYRLDLSNNSFEKVIDFIQSDVNFNDLNDFVETSKGFYFALTEEEDISLYLYTKVNPSDVKDKTVITVGCYYLPYQLRRDIVKFNKTNSDIKIVIKDYGNEGIIMYDTNGLPIDNLENLDKDIIAGKVPDIIILNDYERMSNLAKKGMFVDYNKYFTKENGVDINDISESIINLFSTDGKLFILPPSYSINTFVMKTKLYNALQPYNVETVNKFIKDKGITESEFLGFMLRDYIFNTIISGSGDKFINFKEGSCNFDSKEFKDILMFIKNLPLSEDIYDENYEYVDDSSFYREDKYVLSKLYLSSVSDYIREKYGKFGEDISVVGIPSTDKVVSIYPEYLVGIVENANSDNSFEFVKELFKEDKQSSKENMGYIPVNKKALEKKLETEMKGNFYEEDGKEIPIEDVYYIGDTEIKLPKATKEDIDEIKEIIDSVNSVEIYDDELMNILDEEISSFYNGTKSVDEVVNILQSRVGIYLAERK